MTTESAQTDGRVTREYPGGTSGSNPVEPDGDTATVPEIGGPRGPEPTRYGDWERKGRCIDF
ncbi:MAG: DUF1674 domain-containing protein [Gammaproteobacteria bacterium]